MIPLIDYEEVASYTAEYLLHAYPELLKSRIKLMKLPESDWEFVEMAGKLVIIRGGVNRYTNVSEIHSNECDGIIDDFMKLLCVRKERNGADIAT